MFYRPRYYVGLFWSLNVICKLTTFVCSLVLFYYAFAFYYDVLCVRLGLYNI